MAPLAGGCRRLKGGPDSLLYASTGGLLSYIPVATSQFGTAGIVWEGPQAAGGSWVGLVLVSMLRRPHQNYDMRTGSKGVCSHATFSSELKIYTFILAMGGSG